MLFRLWYFQNLSCLHVDTVILLSLFAIFMETSIEHFFLIFYKVLFDQKTKPSRFQNNLHPYHLIIYPELIKSKTRGEESFLITFDCSFSFTYKHQPVTNPTNDPVPDHRKYIAGSLFKSN